MPIDVRSVGMLKLFEPCCNSLSDEIGEMVCGMMCCFFFFCECGTTSHGMWFVVSMDWNEDIPNCSGRGNTVGS